MKGQRPNEPGDLRRTLNLILFMSGWLTLPAHAVWHRAGSAGVYYFRGHALVAVVFAAVFFALFPDRRNLMVAYYALGFAALRMAWHNLLASRAEARGEWVHPLYVGDSLLAWLGFDNDKAKKDWEPLVTLSLCSVGLAVCPALGWYMVAAAFAMSISHTLWQRALLGQVRAARAARIDQQILAAHMRRT